MLDAADNVVGTKETSTTASLRRLCKEDKGRVRHLVLELAAAKNSTERIQFRRVLLQLNRQMVKLENEKSSRSSSSSDQFGTENWTPLPPLSTLTLTPPLTSHIQCHKCCRWYSLSPKHDGKSCGINQQECKCEQQIGKQREGRFRTLQTCSLPCHGSLAAETNSYETHYLNTADNSTSFVTCDTRVSGEMMPLETQGEDQTNSAASKPHYKCTLEPLQLERECNSTPKLQLYSIVEKDDDMDILKDLFFSSTDQCGR